MITTRDVPSGEIRTFRSAAAADRFLEEVRPGVLIVEIFQPGYARQLMIYGTNMGPGCPCQFRKEAA